VFSSRTGLPYRSQWSLTKHRWQLENDPAAANAVRRLNVAEWIIRGLGGDEVSDASLASRTGWLDLELRTWWSESLDWSGAAHGDASKEVLKEMGALVRRIVIPNTNVDLSSFIL